MEKKSVTFVTAFYNIGRQTEKELNKFENYFSWIENLLSQDINIIFFTSKDIYEKIINKRYNVKFIIEENIPYIKEIKWQNYKSNDLIKDSENFAKLTYSKFLWCLKAIELNPFDSDYFAWVDAGICKVAQNIKLINQLNIRNKISIMLMNYVSEQDFKDLENFLSACRYKVAGGFFSGGKEEMSNFCNLILQEIENYQSFGLEQEYMAIIYKKHNEIFRPYWGDFSDLFINFEKCVNNRNLVQYYMNCAIKNNDYLEYVKVFNFLKM